MDPREPAVDGDDLAALVRTYLDDDEVGLLPDEPDREARLNTWSYEVPEGPVDLASVVEALHVVHLELDRRWSRRSGSGTFYAWYDEQSGHLRCSLSSAPADRLPFGGRYRSTPDAAEVVALAAADSSPGFVPWATPRDVDPRTDDAVDQDPRQPFPVWVAPVG